MGRGCFFTLGSSLITLRVLDLEPDLVSASVGGLELLKPESDERRSVTTGPANSKDRISYLARFIDAEK